MLRQCVVGFGVFALMTAFACDGGKKPAADGSNAPADGAQTPAEPPADSTPPEPEPEPEPEDTATVPTDAVDCGGESCAAPRECITYYGIAGPKGPEFHACEIRCKPGSGAAGCPEGMQCVTVADGPGSVCRAS